MRKTHRFCFSPEFLERKLSPSGMGFAAALAPVQVVMIEEGPSLPPAPTPTDPDAPEPITPDPAPGGPGGPIDPA